MDLAQPKKILLFFYITGLLLAVSVLGVYHPRVWNTALLVALPLVAVLIKGQPFEKIKLATLIVGRVLISLAAFQLFPGQWLAVIVVWLLRINILEAVIQDFSRGRPWNAISGLALIATSFWMTSSWNGTYYLVDQDAYLWWILAYTLWNWDFIAHEFSPSIALFHVGVLGAPLLWMAATGITGFWLIFRGATLIFAVTNQILLKQELEAGLRIPAFAHLVDAIKKTSVQIGFTLFNILLSLLSVWLVFQA